MCGRKVITFQWSFLFSFRSIIMVLTSRFAYPGSNYDFISPFNYNSFLFHYSFIIFIIYHCSFAFIIFLHCSPCEFFVFRTIALSQYLLCYPFYIHCLVIIIFPTIVFFLTTCSPCGFINTVTMFFLLLLPSLAFPGQTQWHFATLSQKRISPFTLNPIAERGRGEGRTKQLGKIWVHVVLLEKTDRTFHSKKPPN